MNRVWMGAAVALAVVAGVMASVQQTVQAGPAIVIKNDGLCGMPGADEDGNPSYIDGGIVTTVVENGNRVIVKCKGENVTNLSGQGQHYSGFACGIVLPSDESETVIITDDTHATVSASGVGIMTCAYKK